jgi:hypothetical protein
VSATVIWRPEPLTARLIAAAKPARDQWAALARSRCTSKRVASSIRAEGETVEASHPLSRIIERGSRAHEIAPGDGPLRLADGRFVSGPVQHPGTPAKPYMRPTLPAWIPLYRKTASGALRGF